MERYHARLQVHRQAVGQLKSTFSRLAFARLATGVGALVSGYFAISSTQFVSTILFIGCLIGFVVLMRIHLIVKSKLRLQQTLVRINEEEIAYLEKRDLPFDDGKQLIEEQHPYTFDLDIFGPQSLYQNLNRTRTVAGAQQLQTALLQRSDNTVIRQRQIAIAELTPLLEWRQLFTAKAILAQDSEKIVQLLKNSQTEKQTLSPVLTVLSYVLPGVGAAGTIAGIVAGFSVIGVNLLILLAVVNLILLASQLKRLHAEIRFGEKISRTLVRYGDLLELCERSDWNSPLLVTIKQRLHTQPAASRSLNQLARIYGSLESLQNGMGALLFNGTVLFHLHTYRQLIRWKQAHAAQLDDWIALIGEVEMLLSFANFATNNPDATFPEITDEPVVQFTALGHPLIPATRRVNNDADFRSRPFMVLTGSNMSGKSTFLRTLGVNMVLANAGAPVCAQKATIHPMDVLVSMRLSDSLTDNESYFFAEVRRLGEIMEKARHTRCFVLLDELLRGTNSDDKRAGTIAVVRKLATGNAIGVIATHDLEVCQTTDEFPGKLINKCFEVTIQDNELLFDYTLRDGICQNKSATFLMQQMGVI